MTTRAQARAELMTALRTAGVRAVDSPIGDPPYVLVGGGGIAMTHVTIAKAPATIRARCVAGAWEAAGVQAILDELIQDTLAVLRAMTGWQMLPVGQDEIRRFTGGDYLTADVSASRMIDI